MAAAGAALAAVIAAWESQERIRGYEDGYDPEIERDEDGMFGYHDSYDEGEADYNRSNE